MEIGKSITWLATLSLTACTVINVWAMIALVQNFDFAAPEQDWNRVLSPVAGLCYVVAALVFNWAAGRGGEKGYRAIAFFVTLFHFLCAFGVVLLLAAGKQNGMILTWLTVFNLPVGTLMACLGGAGVQSGAVACFFLANLMVYQAGNQKKSLIRPAQ